MGAVTGAIFARDSIVEEGKSKFCDATLQIAVGAANACIKEIDVDLFLMRGGA